MGLTCANIHLFMGPDGADAAQVLSRACQQLGYEPVEDLSTTSCQLVSVGEAPWISILDPGGAPVITAELVELAGQLSNASNCPVLLASVYDSDEFTFLVFEKGKQVDGYGSRGDFLPGPYKKWTAKKRVSQWNRLFGTSLSARDLKELAQPPGLFADDQLTLLCRLVELPIEQGTLTAGDLPDRLPATQLRCFRRAAAVAGEPTVAAGRIEIVQVASQKDSDPTAPKAVHLLVEETHLLAFEVVAPIGALSDPVLEVAGTALDQQLVEADEAGGVWHCGLEHVKAGGSRKIPAQVLAHERDGHRVFQVVGEGLSATVFAQLPAPNPPDALAVAAGRESGCRTAAGLAGTRRGRRPARATGARVPPGDRRSPLAAAPLRLVHGPPASSSPAAPIGQAQRRAKASGCSTHRGSSRAW